MADLDDLRAEVAAAVLALPGGTKTRLASDYDERSPVATSETGIQVRATLLNLVHPDSALELEAARIEVVMAFRLPVSTSEQGYAAGQMDADQTALIAHSFWEDLAAVHELTDGAAPGVSLQPELRGSIFVYSVIVDVALAA